ncbi:hypothetical protein ABPG75_007893 [Micractinium tetrahymenae]
MAAQDPFSGPAAVPRTSSVHRLEELELQVQVAHQVNAHLNAEVERMTVAVEALQAERSAFERHIKDLAAKLAAARAALPEAQAAAQAEADAEAAEEAETAAAGEGVLVSDRFQVDLPSSRDLASSTGGSDGTDAAAAADGGSEAQPWLQDAAWQRLQAAGRRQGWLVEPGEVILGEVIGKGTFGVVHRATWRGGCVAVKRVQPRSKEQATTFVREVEALAQLRHPHVMQLYAACVRPPGDFWLICELLSGGTLAAWLYGEPTARRLPQRSLTERLKMALDVARGMQALEEHVPQILHRDLKPSNVFIDSTGTAKIADFGLARILSPAAMVSLTGETGSYLWMAPEVIRHEAYDSRADCWSFGVLLVELLTQQKPYSQLYLTPVQVAIQVADSSLHPQVPPNCHPALAELLLSIFSPDPLERPSFGYIVARLEVVLHDVRQQVAVAQAEGLLGRWSRWREGAAAAVVGGGRAS